MNETVVQMVNFRLMVLLWSTFLACDIISANPSFWRVFLFVYKLSSRRMISTCAKKKRGKRSRRRRRRNAIRTDSSSIFPSYKITNFLVVLQIQH